MTTGSIDQRGERSWRVRLRINGTRMVRTVRGTREDADRALLEMRLEGMGERQPESSATVADVVAAWFSTHRDRVSGSVADDYVLVIKNFLSDGPFAETLVLEVTEGSVDRFYRSLTKAGFGASRVRRIHTVLRQSLRRAHRDGLTSSNPAADADLPPIESTEIDPPSPEQVLSLIDAAEHTHPGLDVFVRLAAITGARRGELCALRFSDLAVHEDDTATLTIARALATAKRHTVDGLASLQEKPTKTNKVRRVALDARTVEMLNTHGERLARRASEADTVLIEDPRIFTDAMDGSVAWRPETASRYWERCRRRAKLPAVRLHDLRHYMATSMMELGHDVTTGMGRGGWANPSQFLGRYAHFRPAPDRAAADDLGNLLDGNT